MFQVDSPLAPEVPRRKKGLMRVKVMAGILVNVGRSKRPLREALHQILAPTPLLPKAHQLKLRFPHQAHLKDQPLLPMLALRCLFLSLRAGKSPCLLPKACRVLLISTNTEHHHHRRLTTLTRNILVRCIPKLKVDHRLDMDHLVLPRGPHTDTHHLPPVTMLLNRVEV